MTLQMRIIIKWISCFKPINCEEIIRIRLEYNSLHIIWSRLEYLISYTHANKWL